MGNFIMLKPCVLQDSVSFFEWPSLFPKDYEIYPWQLQNVLEMFMN